MATNEPPTIFKAPTQTEVNVLISACQSERISLIAERLAAQRDRLVSAIESPKGWKDEYALLNRRLLVVVQTIADIDMLLRVDAAEYVPAIRDVFDRIDKYKQEIA